MIDCDITYHIDKIANCCNCANNEDDPIIHNIPIVGAHAVVNPPDGKTFIGLFH